MPNSKVTIKDVYELVGNLRDEMQDNYVSKSEFLPVKAIAYGIIGMAATAVLASVIGKAVIAIGSF